MSFIAVGSCRVFSAAALQRVTSYLFQCHDVVFRQSYRSDRHYIYSPIAGTLVATRRDTKQCSVFIWSGRRVEQAENISPAGRLQAANACFTAPRATRRWRRRHAPAVATMLACGTGEPFILPHLRRMTHARSLTPTLFYMIIWEHGFAVAQRCALVFSP